MNITLAKWICIKQICIYKDIYIYLFSIIKKKKLLYFHKNMFY